jgi:hypothetical protein
MHKSPLKPVGDAIGLAGSENATILTESSDGTSIVSSFNGPIKIELNVSSTIDEDTLKLDENLSP